MTQTATYVNKTKTKKKKEAGRGNSEKGWDSVIHHYPLFSLSCRGHGSSDNKPPYVHHPEISRMSEEWIAVQRKKICSHLRMSVCLGGGRESNLV